MNIYCWIKPQVCNGLTPSPPAAQTFRHQLVFIYDGGPLASFRNVIIARYPFCVVYRVIFFTLFFVLPLDRTLVVEKVAFGVVKIGREQLSTTEATLEALLVDLWTESVGSAEDSSSCVKDGVDPISCLFAPRFLLVRLLITIVDDAFLFCTLFCFSSCSFRKYWMAFILYSGWRYPKFLSNIESTISGTKSSE
jgi:hypothetical protein